VTIKDTKCNKCGKVYQTLGEAFDCSKSHDQGGQETVDVSYHQVEPIEYIECTIELPKRNQDNV